MGWSHPDISLEDLLNLVKGFVDMIILASGYQSSGLPAIWDVENIKKAIQWSLFFEDVFRRLLDSDDYQDSVKTFDTALLELKATPYFPQGLGHLSSATLTKARDFLLRHFLQTLSLRDAQLSALLMAAIEMDLDKLSKTDDDCLGVYIDMLLSQIKSLNLVPLKRNLSKDSMISSLLVDFTSEGQDNSDQEKENFLHPGSPCISNININEDIGDHSSFMIREILQRQTALMHVSSVERGLDVLLESLTRKTWVGPDNNPLEKQSSFGAVEKEKLMAFILWSQWRSKSISYLLDKRTIRLVSGARLIFSAPKVQWLQVFESLKVSNEAYTDDFLEMIELSLLGIISGRWSSLIEHFMSVSYDLAPFSKQYYDVHHLLEERSQLLHSTEQTMNSMDREILEYVAVELASEFRQLWKLPPILAAAAIPPWSTLFRLYLNEIEKQVKGDSSTSRCCTCTHDGKEHNDCKFSGKVVSRILTFLLILEYLFIFV